MIVIPKLSGIGSSYKYLRVPKRYRLLFFLLRGRQCGHYLTRTLNLDAVCTHHFGSLKLSATTHVHGVHLDAADLKLESFREAA